jgi:hypothetical protein
VLPRLEGLIIVGALVLRHCGLQALPKAQKKKERDALSTPGIQTQKVRGWSTVDELNDADLVVNGR